MSAEQSEVAPAEQTDGYLVVLRPAMARAAYLEGMERRSASPPEHGEFLKYWDDLLKALPVADPGRYAGWDREPIERAPSHLTLAAWPELRAEHLASGMNPDEVPEDLDVLCSPAERLLTERLGEDPNMHWQLRFVSESIIPDIGVAHEILAATDEPDDHEIVRVVRLADDSPGDMRADAPEHTRPETLGFDVGFWGGPFSIISDTMIYPQFHPAPDEDYPELRQHSAALNDNLLFSTVEDARSFRAWYEPKPWAEQPHEPEGCFTIARIDRV